LTQTDPRERDTRREKKKKGKEEDWMFGCNPRGETRGINDAPSTGASPPTTKKSPNGRGADDESNNQKKEEDGRTQKSGKLISGRSFLF
jgi:hypothetical protein